MRVLGRLLPGPSEAVLPSQINADFRVLFIRYERSQEMEYEIPSSARLLPDVYEGATVVPGQQLTEGSKSPHRILRIQGAEATQLYLLTEVQKV